MRMIADAIERGLASANYKADLASKRRSLSAWGTVERRGSGWSWTWTGLGLAIPELLPEPVPCVSADAAWLAMDSIVTEYVRALQFGEIWTADANRNVAWKSLGTKCGDTKHPEAC